ncbi:MAG: heavy metal-associated domain-containing protein [Oscillospiraceae bacterium]|nr:heavy metal-associated domain-containing protein [Oscillospiraceae bacterium]
MNTMICSISNLQNKEDKTRIKNTLDKVRGVQEVGVNRSTGSITVKFNAPADEDQIKRCMEHAGFQIQYE